MIILIIITMQKKQKKKQIDVKKTLILHRRTFIFYLICCRCFKSTKGNLLLIQYQSLLHFRSINCKKYKPLIM